MKSAQSRREQILRGIATPPGRPCVGFQDRRRAARRLPPVGLGRPAIGAGMARTSDISEHGLAVFAELTLGVGDSVPVKFAGHEAVGARIAWKNNGLVGLAVEQGFRGRPDGTPDRRPV